MPAFLAEQLDHFGRQVRSDAWKGEHHWAMLAADVGDMVALALHLLDRIEAAAGREQPAPPAWDEAAARRCVPLFRQWFDDASAVLELARACGAQGQSVEGLSEFVHRYNSAKLIATDLDKTASAYRARQRGESNGRPIAEVLDELQH
jgi:hypothetical protein